MTKTKPHIRKGPELWYFQCWGRGAFSRLRHTFEEGFWLQAASFRELLACIKEYKFDENIRR